MFKIPLKKNSDRLVNFAKRLDEIRQAREDEIPQLIETALKEFLA
jgi:hypothetical protein